MSGVVRFVCRVACVMCRVDCVMCRVAHVMCRVARFVCRVSQFLCTVSQSFAGRIRPTVHIRKSSAFLVKCTFRTSP